MKRKDFATVSPKNSDSHAKLILAAKKAGIDSNILREMLWLIVAHDHLIALPQAVSTIYMAIKLAPPSWGNALQESGIRSWEPILDWILRERKNLATEIGNHFNKKTNSTGRSPISGSGVSFFPMYSALCEIRPEGTLEQKFILLTGQLLLAHVTAMKEQSSLQQYEAATSPWHPLFNRADSAALAVRRLAEHKYQQELEVLPVEMAPEQFAEELEDIEASPSNVIQGDRQHLWRFLQKAYDIISWNEKSPGGSVGSGGHKWVGGRLEIRSRLILEPQTLNDPDDASEPGGSVNIVRRKLGRIGAQRMELDSDLSPDENEDEDLAILAVFSCDESKQDLGSLARVARARARHVEKANQLAPFSYDGLAIEEMGRLLESIQRDLNPLVTLDSWNDDQLILAEALVLLHVMLWTSRDIEGAAEICLDLEGQVELNCNLALHADAALSRACWKIRALTPDYRTELPGSKDQLRAQSDAFYLQALKGLAKIFTRILKNREAAHGIRIFQTPTSTLKKSVRKWLKNYSPDGRVTAGKIAWSMWAQLYLKQGDPALTCCTLGVDHHLARVRLFYTSPRIDNLQDTYNGVVGEISMLGLYAIRKPPKDPAWWMSTQIDPGNSVGSRLCPTVDAVKKYFAALVKDIKAEMDYADRPGFIKFHNLYTLYVVQFFAYSTSCRAIKTPYLPPSEIDFERGIAALTDKDDGTHHKTRLVWLPEKLREQMLFYENHLATLRAQLSHLTSDVLHEPCFFLSDSFEPLLVRPKTIEPLLTHYLDVKPNTHRRFLRTELIERNCSPEVVDAFIGHWQQGEEPHGTFSTFNFGEYQRVIQGFLEPIHNEIGLTQAIPSRLSR